MDSVFQLMFLRLICFMFATSWAGYIIYRIIDKLLEKYKK